MWYPHSSTNHLYSHLIPPTLSAGPFAAMWYVYSNSAMPTSSGTPCPTWVLAMAAMGIVAGLNTYGYK